MPPKMGQTKKAKAEAASKAKKGGAKKWNKTSNREKLDNAVMFNKDTLQKLRNDVPKYKVITPSIVSDRLKISASVAAAGLKQLCREKQIRLVSCSSKNRIYSKIAAPVEEAPAAPAAESK